MMKIAVLCIVNGARLVIQFWGGFPTKLDL